MTKLFNPGDLVRIPQGVMLTTPWNYIVIEKESYGIYHKELAFGMDEVIYEGQAWTVESENIFQGEE